VQKLLEPSQEQTEVEAGRGEHGGRVELGLVVGAALGPFRNGIRSGDPSQSRALASVRSNARRAGADEVHFGYVVRRQRETPRK
jgi:hypothetical protein